MRVRLKQWRQPDKFTPKWGLGAIATPVLLTLVGWLSLLPALALQPDDSNRIQNETGNSTESRRNFPIGSFEVIVTVIGVAFLVRCFRRPDRHAGTADFRGADLNGANFCDANLSGADLSGADLSSANLSGADLSGADLSGANLIQANLSGANLNGALLKYASLKGADLRYTNLRDSDLRYANLRDADLNCTFLKGANLGDADLGGALLFFVNLREVLNLEPLQLKAKPSPFLCHAALPYYSQQYALNSNAACDRIPKILSDRYDIPLEEAQEIVSEARQHRWD
ncbi:pentapeptide repeat-containing protein [Spirulina major CS-329]|uniref:pentapeptide repeat-containing protein n=1 Tax=Spirulina TaxID=1154 RepID=UPI00232AEC71|nr:MULTISPECIES: pentapeptide repeat-containing protein [Spirulina]MDB9496731.1 pentapeptide repeat-containing protein [Spirulina subsalsa CS-330]MDB9503206.1 pentapeptide repeat-containing protein [Spirulina major CS-329]